MRCCITKLRLTSTVVVEKPHKCQVILVMHLLFHTFSTMFYTKIQHNTIKYSILVFALQVNSTLRALRLDDKK